MLAELTRFYAEKKIGAETFDCFYKNRCKDRCNDFVAAREAFVGSEYEKGTLPRLLFVSLDPSNDYPGREPSKRTLAYMRYWEEKSCVVAELHGGSHWYRTHEFAHELLRPVAVTREVAGFRLDNVHRFFAHTDSAKCKDAARGVKKGHPELFTNCRTFIPGEIVVLRPDVLVAQGNEAKMAIKEGIKEGLFREPKSVCHPQRPDYEYKVVEIAGKPTFVLSLFHPSARWRFYKERMEAYPWYFESAKSFLLRYDTAK